jgi:hypothetical protein
VPVNADKPHLWKKDIAASVDFYNNWFIKFAPKTFRNTRTKTAEKVIETFKLTEYFKNISAKILKENPAILSILRMTTAPPIARDRLIGLSSTKSNLVKSMELKHRIPPNMNTEMTETELRKISKIIKHLIDKDLFDWLDENFSPNEDSIHRAATIVADRLCGAISDPIIRNAQEERQLSTIRKWLEKRDYSYIKPSSIGDFLSMQIGTFTFRLNIPIKLDERKKSVNIPVDAVILPKVAKSSDFPVLIEAKSAGDFRNPNKRRKEEAIKIAQLRSNYGEKINYILFLCGYFDSGYLGYEAAEGIDWIWEHRIDDLELLKL